ncbi:MAG: DNA-binding protein, partial [Bacteroidota bacterium]|nr:DNA-binding protein [Bacteroidota bacterium]
FWHDPNIPVEEVGITCERCPLPLDRCSERVVPASILDRENLTRQREAALEAWQNLYQED